jgi:hypothetical protein
VEVRRSLRSRRRRLFDDRDRKPGLAWKVSTQPCYPRQLVLDLEHRLRVTQLLVEVAGPTRCRGGAREIAGVQRQRAAQPHLDVRQPCQVPARGQRAAQLLQRPGSGRIVTDPLSLGGEEVEQLQPLRVNGGQPSHRPAGQ